MHWSQMTDQHKVLKKRLHKKVSFLRSSCLLKILLYAYLLFKYIKTIINLFQLLVLFVQFEVIISYFESIKFRANYPKGRVGGCKYCVTTLGYLAMPSMILMILFFNEVKNILYLKFYLTQNALYKVDVRFILFLHIQKLLT